LIIRPDCYGKAFATVFPDNLPLRPIKKTMKQSTIKIDVTLDESRVPENITWIASDTTTEQAQKAKAMMLSFWDGADKTALRIDLWTKEMMVDEMADFFYQTMMTMADTFGKATNNNGLVDEMKSFSKTFYEKFRDSQVKEKAV
jgi:gliding motility-associated protein GldC